MTEATHQADRLCRLFCGIVDGIITSRALEQAVESDLSRAQFMGLQYVHLHPDCCIKDLALGLGISHPAAVKLVERLESKALVQRSPHARDGRVVQLAATELGTTHAAATISARNQAIEKILANIGSERTCDLLRCLDAFVRAALEEQKDVDGACLRCGGTHDDECPVCQAELELTGELRRDLVRD